MPSDHDCSGEAAAYVLGALDRAEAEAFVSHMARCVVCRDEVAALRDVVDSLPLAAPQYSVPRRLRRRVLSAARAEPRKAERPSARRIDLLRPLRAAAVVATLALAIVGVVELALGSGGVRVVPARVAAAAARAEVRLAGGRAELVVHHLPPPGVGHIYEVWLKRGDAPPTPTSTLFSVTSGGSGAVGVPGSLRGVSEVLVTPEPAGGSLVPTRPPVIVAQLS
jgi:anti-sigma factor RsiW